MLQFLRKRAIPLVTGAFFFGIFAYAYGPSLTAVLAKFGLASVLAIGTAFLVCLCLGGLGYWFGKSLSPFLGFNKNKSNKHTKSLSADFDFTSLCDPVSSPPTIVVDPAPQNQNPLRVDPSFNPLPDENLLMVNPLFGPKSIYRGRTFSQDMSPSIPLTPPPTTPRQTQAMPAVTPFDDDDIEAFLLGPEREAKRASQGRAQSPNPFERLDPKLMNSFFPAESLEAVLLGASTTTRNLSAQEKIYQHFLQEIQRLNAELGFMPEHRVAMEYRLMLKNEPILENKITIAQAQKSALHAHQEANNRDIGKYSTLQSSQRLGNFRAESKLITELTQVVGRIESRERNSAYRL